MRWAIRDGCKNGASEVVYVFVTVNWESKSSEMKKEKKKSSQLVCRSAYLAFFFLFSSEAFAQTEQTLETLGLKSDRIPHRNGTKVCSSPSLVNGSRSIISFFTSLLTANKPPTSSIPLSLATWYALIQSPDDCSIRLLLPLPLILSVERNGVPKGQSTNQIVFSFSPVTPRYSEGENSVNIVRTYQILVYPRHF